MVVSADTSFLFSLYGNDVFTHEAQSKIQDLDSPLSLSQLSEFEFSNAMRLAEFRGLKTTEDTQRSLSSFANDVAADRIEFPPINLGEVVSRGRALSKNHTTSGGHRGFDILLVAFALEIGAEKFLTFDKNQAALAEGEGLTVPA